MDSSTFRPAVGFALAVLAGASLTLRLPAADPVPPSPWRDLDRYSLSYTAPGSQLKDFIYERSRQLFAAGDAERDAIKTPADLRARQEKIRRTFIANLGGLPPSDTPLNARVTGTVEGRGFTVEKVIFESRPHNYVTANLYLPAQRTGRSAAVLFLCGHHLPAKQQPEYQGVAQSLVQAGLIVLVQDPVGQGERLSYLDSATQKPLVPGNTYEHDHAGAQARFLGDDIARYFLHDAMRSIDYLCTRSEVDPTRIGVTGNSGGGTQTSMVMLADPRIAAAAPGTFIMNRDSYQRTGQPQDAEQIWSGFTGSGFDHEDILLAMAPRPVRVLSVRSDFFPIEGTRRTVSRVRRFWEMSGKADAFDLVEDDSVHSYTPKLALAAARFFSKQLLGHEANVTGFVPQPLSPEKLQCTRSGQVATDFPDAQFVFDSTSARFREAEADRAKLPEAARKAKAVQWLREQVMRDRATNPPNPRRIERGMKIGNLDVDVAFWWSQPYIANLGMLIRPRNQSGQLPVTVALWEDGTAAISRHGDWIQRECERGRAVFVIDLSGMGPLRPDPVNGRPMREFYGTWHKLSDDLDFAGDSLVALRTYEFLRSLDVVLTEWPELGRDDIRVFAQGRIGVHAKLAAALDSRIKGCDWEGAFSFADFARNRMYDSADIKTVIVPGVLRHFDLGDL